MMSLIGKKRIYGDFENLDPISESAMRGGARRYVIDSGTSAEKCLTTAITVRDAEEVEVNPYKRRTFGLITAGRREGGWFGSFQPSVAGANLKSHFSWPRAEI